MRWTGWVEAGGAVKSTSGSTIDFRIEKARAMLGWEPQVSVEEGIARLVRWIEAHAAGPFNADGPGAATLGGRAGLGAADAPGVAEEQAALGQHEQAHQQAPCEQGPGPGRQCRHGRAA